MMGHITVVQVSGSNSSQISGYSNLTNFSITLTGSDLVGLSALGVVVLVAIMMIFTRDREKKPTARHVTKEIL